MLLVALAIAALIPQKSAKPPAVTVRGPEPGVVKLGDTATATVSVVAESAELLPIANVEGLSIRVSPPIRQSSSEWDGRTMRSSVTVSWQISLRPSKEGTFVVPALKIRAAGEVIETRELRVEAVKDIQGSKYGFLETRIPKTTYFVHEPIRVRLRFGIDRAVMGSLISMFRVPLDLPVQLTAPWLTELPGAVILANDADGRTPGDLLSMVTNDQKGQARRAGSEERGGRTYEVFEFERSYLPGRAGELELSAPLLRMRIATRVERDWFGERRAAAAEDSFAYGDAAKLTVLPIPEAGRPASFAGAVGVFRISADATPRTLKAGESLKLTLRIEGEGNFEFFEPPRLDPMEGFHVFGKLEDKGSDHRVITYDLSPLSENVKEIPPIPFSYFDVTPPGSFKTVKTPPIALTVRPLPPGEGLAALPSDEKRVVAGVDDIFDMKPPSDAESAAPGPTLGALLLGSPWVVAGLAWIRIRKRERDAADPARVRARRAAAQFRASIARGTEPAAAFTTFLADRLGCAEAAVVSSDLAERLAARGVKGERAARALLDAVSHRYAGAKGSAPSADFATLVDELESEFSASERRA